MSQTYTTRARAAAAPQKAERRSSPELSPPAPSMVSLAADAQPDRQTDLAGAIQARMDSAFGTDLSPLRQEAGQTVAPRQGAMSAGEPTWSGPVTAPLSAASAAPAAGPMQAKKNAAKVSELQQQVQPDMDGAPTDKPPDQLPSWLHPFQRMKAIQSMNLRRSLESEYG